MLRVETVDSADSLRIKLEGRLAGNDAEHARIVISSLEAAVQPGTDMGLVVDLTEVVFIDALGEEVLSFLGRLGAQFVATTSYAIDVCERLHLPLDGIGNPRQSALGSFPKRGGPSGLDRNPKNKV
jgi:hypothetical protein